MTAAGRFDAILFDAGGVLVIPDPLVLGPLLAYYGGDATFAAHHRAHYAAMAAKSRSGADESSWEEYNDAYVAAVGVPTIERAEAASVLGRTRSAWLWRHPIPDARAALATLAAAGTPIGVVSNASGQIESVLARAVCQVGPGPHVEVRCVVDSHVVGYVKPDPRIFEPALTHFAGIDRSRIAYVGDSVTMDVGAANAAGLHPILLDPYADLADLPPASAGGADRIAALAELL